MLRALGFSLAVALSSTFGPLVESAEAQRFSLGAVYSATNQPAGNEVAVALRLPPFARAIPFARFATGGLGTGAGLGSQGVLAAEGNWLVAANPGSDDITLFRTFGKVFLFRVDTEPSGGARPTSVAIHRNLVFALNADSDSVSSFRIVNRRLRHVGTWPLSGLGVAAAQVGVDPSGRFLVVTERATNQIVTFPIRRTGELGTIRVHPSAGQTPFGFLFRFDSVLIVSEAAGGAAGASTASTYRLQRDGSLSVLTAAAPTNQSAACWIAMPPQANFTYTTNTGSGTLSGFRITGAGELVRVDRSGATGELQMDGRPIDAEFDPSGTLVFVLDNFHDEIVAFRRSGDGRLQLLPGSLPLPDGAAGVLVR